MHLHHEEVAAFGTIGSSAKGGQLPYRLLPYRPLFEHCQFPFALCEKGPAITPALRCPIGSMPLATMAGEAAGEARNWISASAAIGSCEFATMPAE
jgi:hypothetical protein